VRLIGYTRSSDVREQEESHASQETTIRAGARPHGHRIVRVISEPAGGRRALTWRRLLVTAAAGLVALSLGQAVLRGDREAPALVMVIVVGLRSRWPRSSSWLSASAGPSASSAQQLNGSLTAWVCSC
jgi:hypothetical protein